MELMYALSCCARLDRNAVEASGFMDCERSDLAGRRQAAMGTVVGASRYGRSLITAEARLRFEVRTEDVVASDLRRACHRISYSVALSSVGSPLIS